MAIRFETVTSVPLFVYPQSGLAFYNNELFMTTERSLDNLETLKHVLRKYPNTLAEVNYWEFNPPRKYILSAFFSQGRSSVSMYFSRRRLKWVTKSVCVIHYDFFTAQALKLQCIVRRWAKGRLEARRLALAMSWHYRLGIGSGIQVLGSDVLSLIINH
jgi:hypothetical protein